MDKQKRVYKTKLADRDLVIEIGELAGLANGSCLVKYGDTVVLVTATASSKPREGIDFLPLSVDFEEKLYAVGKIPGGYGRREGRPSEKAILASRMIDRPLRPLFPKDLRNDIAIVATVLSVDQDNSPEIAAILGASIALSISDIPFNKPIAGLNVGLVDDKFVINPNTQDREKSKMLITVVGTAEKIVMLEAGAQEIPEPIVFESIKYAHQEIKKICEFIEQIKSENEIKEKIKYEVLELNPELTEEISKYAIDLLKNGLDNSDKKARDANVDKVIDQVHAEFDERYPDEINQIDEILYKLQKKIVRNWVIQEQKRVDGRNLDEIRELYADVGILPRTHGSGLFSRGQTQVLTVVTLGPLRDVQRLDGIDEDEQKRYMLHYNFPSFSTGETRPSRGPGRREIGHGALAERSLEPVIPSVEEFPYAIRLVSEVLTSNGSTSQASVCGSSLALLDAGVPIKSVVAGISVGLFTEENNSDRFTTVVDIQGIEDFFGDMDFKVAGSKKGITSIQVDIKIDGLSLEIIEEALRKAKIGRKFIMDTVMKDAIAKCSGELSKYAPKIASLMVHPDKVRDVIGAGGKVIQKIIADTGVKIDVETDGRINIFSADLNMLEKAKEIILGITQEVETGKVYKGTVTKTASFGAFVEFLPNKEGLVHISKIDNRRVERVEDLLNVGDEVRVRVLGTDKQGRTNLAMSHVQ